MKLDKSNICVFIENEAQLQEARELLERYEESVDGSIFKHSQTNRVKRHLVFSIQDGDWWTTLLGSLVYVRQEITISELEEILKGDNE